MSKSILIIDTPTTCAGCPCYDYIHGVCAITYKDCELRKQEKPEWCPLRQLPEWKDVPEYLETNRDWEAWGFDQCLTEILGDAEGETE